MTPEDVTVEAFMDAMKPMLDLMKSEIVASQQATIVQLKESFLQQILQLNKTISEYTTRAVNLEEKMAALQKEMKEIKTVPKPTYATITGNNLPKKPPVRNTTSNPVNNQSTSKGHQEKAKKERLTQAKYPIAEREIVISFENGLKCEPTDENVFRALKTMNKVIAENKDLEKPPYIRAHFTLNNNLALTVGLDNCALDYELHLKVITESIKFVREGAAIVNEKWPKFLLYGIPTFGALEEIRNDVDIYHPKLKLGQTLRWLVPADKRTEKPVSTIVLAFIGTVTSKDIDRSLTVLNIVCHILPYYPYDPQTQCHRC
jgi:hypothetical protein